MGEKQKAGILFLRPHGQPGGPVVCNTKTTAQHFSSAKFPAIVRRQASSFSLKYANKAQGQQGGDGVG